ncbi:sugar ABC transporter permease [Protaetiibacter larvae]|uniref:Xylose transport system permease protein XylH n=1 Tax=Protaetiibacter larvae TaxID=2592654 RepID=A0A5C1Y9C7_9MICO|nr:sugar ABC transporter permease [Protaetiibacter larvae]QEO09998.1 sugar ABC transporter permease [Protaetiibacter larvae]
MTDTTADRTSWLRIALGDLRTRLTGGNLGSVPVIVGLVVIWGVFQALNPSFLSADNLVNLTLQCAAVGTIAIGVVLVLLLGQIDLSVGSVSGLAAAIVGVGLTQLNWPLAVTILCALLTGVAIGLLYGFLYTRFGVPSFIITLAGLLGILGLQLKVLGPTGSINIPFDSPLVLFATSWFLPPWLAYAISGLWAGSMFVSAVLRQRRRKRADLPTAALGWQAAKAGGLFLLCAVAVSYLATDDGVGVMFVFFIVLVIVMDVVLTRTRWGREVYAVGGSVEAARRAGIRVNRVYVSVFVLCSTFAVVGGILAAGRLSSASLSSGGGDTNLNAIAAAVIGGTSLFGGRGSAWSALLGIAVIQSISNGLTLLNLDSSIRYMITGGVLLLAVIIDSLSRKSRAAHGQA